MKYLKQYEDFPTKEVLEYYNQIVEIFEKIFTNYNIVKKINAFETYFNVDKPSSNLEHNHILNISMISAKYISILVYRKYEEDYKELINNIREILYKSGYPDETNVYTKFSFKYEHQMETLFKDLSENMTISSILNADKYNL